MRMHGGMSGKRRTTCYASLLTIGLFLTISLTGVGVTGWTAEVSVNTGEAYSGVPFTCSVISDGHVGDVVTISITYQVNDQVVRLRPNDDIKRVAAAYGNQ